MGASDFLAHPALLDAALHTIRASGVAVADEGAVLLPFEWSNVRVGRTGAERLLVRAEPDGDGAVRLTMTDPDGRLVLAAGALALRQATPDQIRAARQTSDLYAVGPHHLAVTAEELAVRDAARLTVVGSGRAADLLADRASRVDDLDAAAADVAEGRASHVVLDLTRPAGGVTDASGDALATLQRVLAWAPAVPVTVVTEAASAVGITRAGDVDIAAAAVWGMTRSARSEAADLVLRQVDLDRDAGTDDLLAALAPLGEPEVLARGGELRAPRLERADGGEARSWVPDPDRAVLLTGGTGEIGRALAVHLVRTYGVRHLVITSRRGEAAPGAAELRAELSVAGAEEVAILACDVSDAAQLDDLLAHASRRPWSAVLHLAGVLDDGLLADQYPGAPRGSARGQDGRSPGPGGSAPPTSTCPRWCSSHRPPAAPGSPGQSTYAAANHALDVLAASARAGRRAARDQFCPGGLWQPTGVGMTAHLWGADRKRMRRQGIAGSQRPPRPQPFDAALRHGAPALAPVRLDLAALEQQAADGEAVPGILRALVKRPAPLEGDQEGAVATRGLGDEVAELARARA